MSVTKLFEYNSLLCKCVFYFNKIFGCATMTFGIASPQIGGRWSFKYSSNGVIYNIFLIFVVIISDSFSSYKWAKSDNILFEHKIGTINIIIRNFTAVFILVKFFVQQGKFIEIINKIRSIRESLKHISGKLLFKKNCSTYHSVFKIFLPIFMLSFTSINNFYAAHDFCNYFV